MNDISIAVDAMGGDNAPRAICEGTLAALREMNDIRVTLCGREAEIRPFFDRTVSRGPDMSRIDETPSGYLCFHRLSIMGLHPEGMQPFHLGRDMVV